MSSLRNSRPPVLVSHSENGHIVALRRGAAFIFDRISTVPIVPGLSVVTKFSTGDNSVIFESAIFSVDQELVTFEVFEDSTFSFAGVVDSTLIRKLNRLSSREPEVKAYNFATLTDPGTLILHDIVRGQPSQNQTVFGFGTDTGINEVVLKPNTDFIFKITNGSAGVVTVGADIYFREEDLREYEDNP